VIPWFHNQCANPFGSEYIRRPFSPIISLRNCNGVGMCLAIDELVITERVQQLG